MTKMMATMRWVFPGKCDRNLSPEPGISWTWDCSFHKAAKGFALKTQHLPTLNSRPNFIPLNGNASKRKGANVACPNTSLSSTLDLLDAYEDEYDGLVIDPNCLPSSANAFVAILRSSLSYWKLKGKKGIWLRILAEQADLVPIAIKEGFTYHHAEPGYVVLTCWLPEETCTLPANATHQVGIGGFVMNEKREVLVVKERQCPCRCSGVWKLPTGFINKSEELFCGAVREVKEETGIDTAFMEVIAFRHAHLVAFEKSDLFFICTLRPLSLDINIDESEIQDAKWMPLNEFLAQPFYQEDDMCKKAIDLCIARYENHYSGLIAHQLMSKFDGKLSYLYYNDFKVI
ncbi:nudix hydrolase 8-like [Tasmannia lanceolata]|uniref:nudix hydrolase 8-like n=1 Tax=Tasmannia lanceolata TaxID=3420 RepID=UPI0040628D62